jgi:NAD(P)-dependent dehydrogenase (short-subunit alcohol dehydrogenase family)
MNRKLKKLSEQVIVITGASSGIGLCTAKLAARQGARVVLSSRNERDLQQAVDEIHRAGGEAIYFVGDVANPDDMDRLAQTTVDRFGGFDTWVNNAGVTVYGKLTEVELREKRRLFDVNFWGVVHGCRSALPHLRARGGSIINIGSVLSDVSIPLQGIYSASKHAVKGYTDALRMEIEADRLPVSVTLIKPAAINTPYTEHALNKLGTRPKHVPPVYAPEVVARAIIECCSHPVRELGVGGGAKMMGLMNKLMPKLADRYMEATMIDGQQSGEAPYSRSLSGLFGGPRREGKVDGDYRGHVMRSSLYTRFALHPLSTGLLAFGLGLLARGAVTLVRERPEAETGGERAIRAPEASAIPDQIRLREEPPNDTGAAA